MLGKRITLFQLLGFEIRVDASWLFLVLLITWSLAVGAFPAWYAGLPGETYWWMAVAAVIGLMASLVFHELAHSVVARAYGLPIGGITLFIFGGVAEMEEEPQSAAAEFWMAIAGPVASGILAVGFRLLAAIGEGFGLPLPLTGVLAYLGYINGLLAAFNLVPAFPLDGGRVLRAALWQWRGDFGWATGIAARSGALFGTALIGFGVLTIVLVRGSLVGGLWFCLIGLFLRGAAQASLSQMLTRRTFEGETVARFMTRDPVTVPPDLSIADFVERHLYRTHHGLYPVVEGGRLLGCVGARQVKTVRRDEWALLPLGEVLQPLGPDNSIAADTDAVQALARMRQSRNGRLMVTDNGRLVGVITLKDMLDLFALKMDLEARDDSGGPDGPDRLGPA